MNDLLSRTSSSSIAKAGNPITNNIEESISFESDSLGRNDFFFRFK